ncbi:unnamed protein product, partial [Laminaria digitata]
LPGVSIQEPRPVSDHSHHALTPSSHKRVIVLGSTGSIGKQTLEVIAHLNALTQQGKHSTRYEVVGLAAGSDHDTLFTQARNASVSQLSLAVPVA